MRLPTMARARASLFTTLAAAGVLLTACAGEPTAPTALGESAAVSGMSPLSPVDASAALIGTRDGTYTFTVDPRKDQRLQMGFSALDIPAGAICRLSDSGYGAAYWNESCRSESRTMTITATVRNARSDHPRIDFEPALRFNPEKRVQLYMFVDKRSKSADWTILYCSTRDAASCVNEAKADPSLEARVLGMLVTRRIKHFSGYVVTNLAEDAGALLGW